MPASDSPSIGLSNAQCLATDRALLRVELQVEIGAVVVAGTEDDVLTVGDDGQVVRALGVVVETPVERAAPPQATREASTTPSAIRFVDIQSSFGGT